MSAPRRAVLEAQRREQATLEGMVVAAYRRRFGVRLDRGDVLDCVMKGRRMQLACGDRVEVRAMPGGGAIEAVMPRRNLIYRSDAFKEKLIGANVTLVVGVVAPDLPCDLELVERWTVAAEAEGCRFLLVANKADLPDFERLVARLAPYRALGYEVLPVSAKRDIEPLRPMLAGEHSVLVGQSGMGKSTILNAIVPDAAARVSDISAALAAGRHTTTSTALYPISSDPRDGWIIDAPGMKAFSLAHLEPDRLAEAFVEFRPFLGRCRFRDCRHVAEPGCALFEAVERGLVAAHRLALLQAMRAESDGVRGWANAR